MTQRAILMVMLMIVVSGCGSRSTHPRPARSSRDVADVRPTFEQAKSCIERAHVRAGKPFPTLLKAFRARDADPDATIRIVGPDDDDWWAYVSIDGDAKRSARVLRSVNSDPDEEANMTSPDMFRVGTGADFAWWIPTGTGEFAAMFAGPELDAIHRCVDPRPGHRTS